MKYDVFISYRHEDSLGRSNVANARQIKQALEGPPYHYIVFFDYSECTDDYFSEIILPAIRTCDFFVLVLTKDSLLRCKNEGDWVRREIEEAIASGVKIIPVSPDKECDSFPEELPQHIKEKFKYLQITTIHTDAMFDYCIKFLVEKRFHLFPGEPRNEEEKKRKLEERLEAEHKAMEERMRHEHECKKNDEIELKVKEIVEKILDVKGLGEGVQRKAEGRDTQEQMNELKVVIIDMSDPRFGYIVMSAVDMGYNADSLIENSKIKYLKDIANLAKKMVNEFSPRKEQILANLHALLSEYQCCGDNGRFPDVVGQLRTLFVAMMEGLIAEKKQHADEYQAIENELSLIKTCIKENNPGGSLGRGHRRQHQLSWLDVYSNKVRFEMGNNQKPSLARLKVEDIRMSEAVLLYEKMIQMVDEFYRSDNKESVDGQKER